MTGIPASFPFLFGGTFIEGRVQGVDGQWSSNFPSFSEGLSLRAAAHLTRTTGAVNFPSFSEGLSLRDAEHSQQIYSRRVEISLPFRRDFH